MVIVKVGGALSASPAIDIIAADIAALRRERQRVLLVHGGGPQLDEAAAQAGLHTSKVAGRRITSGALIGLAEATWRGRLSMAWVRALRRQGLSAVGLSGLDGGLLHASRRPPVEVTDDTGRRQTVDYGHVGDLLRVDTTVLDALLPHGLIPVVTPLAMGPQGGSLNVNADTVAAALAGALCAERLVLLSTTDGVRADPLDPHSTHPRLSLRGLKRLEAAGALQGGMRPKVAAIRAALREGVGAVQVADGRRPGSCLGHIGVGTTIDSSSSIPLFLSGSEEITTRP